ncbi:MAG: cation transporter [Verrucomicrobiales bacterium]|nr:cation transporter [Verrucomicrobiales bacterium]
MARTTLYRALIFTLLFTLWVVLSGLLDAFHLTLGVISCGLVTWLSGDFLFSDRSSSLAVRFRQSIRMISYCGWLLWQIVLANIQVFRLAFGPKSDLQPQIVRFQTNLQTDFEKFLLANSITLTPGTVTIKILGDTFYVHAISDTAAAGLDGTMENKISAIFASPSTKAMTEV